MFRLGGTVSSLMAAGSASGVSVCPQRRFQQVVARRIKPFVPSGTVQNPNDIEGLDVKVGNAVGLVTPDPASRGPAVHREEFIRVAELENGGGFVFYHPERRVSPSEGRDTRSMLRLKARMEMYNHLAKPTKDEIMEMRELRARDMETWTAHTLAQEFKLNPKDIIDNVPLTPDQYLTRKDEDEQVDKMRYHERKTYLRNRAKRLKEHRVAVIAEWKAARESDAAQTSPVSEESS